MKLKDLSLCRYSFIFVLPLAVLITSFLFRAASGPFWQYADVCYIYLLNALPILKGHPPFDIHHPGTPLQILIAIIIWIFNFGRPTAETITQVLINPEFYLYAVYVFLVLSSFITSIILGAYVYHKTNDKLAALLTQLTGFSFLILPSFNNGNFPVLPVLASVSPEPLFISLMNLFNLFLLKLYFSKNEPQKQRNILILALICGLGLAAKVNFFFVMLSALIIIPLRSKILFIVVSVMSFVFCTLPIIGRYPWLFHWLTDMVDHASRYGAGSGKFIDWTSFCLYSGYLIRSHWFFIFSALGLWIWSSFHIIKDRQNQNIKFIWTLCFCSLLHFAATAKHFSFHYLLPAIALFSPIFLLFYLNQKNKYKIIKPLAAAFILLFIGTCTYYMIPYYKKLMVLSQDIRHLNDRVKTKYPDCTIIPSTTEDIILFFGKEEALLMANITISNTESEDLSRLYPHAYYFYSEEFTSPDPNVASYGLWDFNQRVFTEDLASTCPCFIFTKYPSDLSLYPYQVRLVDQSKYLNAYLLIHSTEKEANELFLQALDALKKGNYQQAMALGLKSRQLNYEPRRQLEYVLTIIYHNLLKSQGLSD